MAESETRPVLGGGAVQQAKAKSLLHVRLIESPGRRQTRRQQRGWTGRKYTRRR